LNSTVKIKAANLTAFQQYHEIEWERFHKSSQSQFEFKQITTICVFFQTKTTNFGKEAIAKKVIRKNKVADETRSPSGIIKLKKGEKTTSAEVKSSKYFSSDIPEYDGPVDERVLWHPPRSPYKFIQEKLYKDPWRLLISTIFLNKTTGKAACPLVWKFLERWPSPESASRADPNEIAQLMNPLGLHETRARRIIKMSSDYLTKKWVNATELYGISKYGQDSYRLFCRGEWQDVRPTDIMLCLYRDWIWTNQKALKLQGI